MPEILPRSPHYAWRPTFSPPNLPCSPSLPHIALTSITALTTFFQKACFVPPPLPFHHQFWHFSVSSPQPELSPIPSVLHLPPHFASFFFHFASICLPLPLHPTCLFTYIPTTMSVTHPPPQVPWSRSPLPCCPISTPKPSPIATAKSSPVLWLCQSLSLPLLLESPKVTSG